MSREMQEVKELTDKVCKEHRIVESHWHGEGPYRCICGAEVNAVSEDALRWIFQFHCVSEGIAYAQKEIERLLADERERVREMCARYVERHWVSGDGREAYPYFVSSSDVPQRDLVYLGNAIRQLDLTALDEKEKEKEKERSHEDQ